MAKPISKFKEFIKCANKFKDEAEPIVSRLQMLGMKINLEGEISFNWEYIPEIKDRFFKSEDYKGIGIPWIDQIALAITIRQEECNGFFPQEDIDFVNNFLGLDITQKDMSRMHKYL